MLLASLLPLLCSAIFLIQARPTGLEMALPEVGQTLLHHLRVKKIPHRHKAV